MKTLKITQIMAIVLMVIPSLMLVMSGVMKLMGAQQIVDGLTKVGLANYIVIFGLIELISVGLLWIPKNTKYRFLSFVFLSWGALSIELAGNQLPMAAIFIALLWISILLKDKSMFLKSVTN